MGVQDVKPLEQAQQQQGTSPQEPKRVLEFIDPNESVPEKYLRDGKVDLAAMKRDYGEQAARAREAEKLKAEVETAKQQLAQLQQQRQMPPQSTADYDDFIEDIWSDSKKGVAFVQNTVDDRVQHAVGIIGQNIGQVLGPVHQILIKDQIEDRGIPRKEAAKVAEMIMSRPTLRAMWNSQDSKERDDAIETAINMAGMNRRHEENSPQPAAMFETGGRPTNPAHREVPTSSELEDISAQFGVDPKRAAEHIARMNELRKAQRGQ